MLRVLYAVAVALLISGSVVTAQNIDRDARPERGIALSQFTGIPH